MSVNALTNPLWRLGVFGLLCFLPHLLRPISANFSHRLSDAHPTPSALKLRPQRKGPLGLRLHRSQRGTGRSAGHVEGIPQGTAASSPGLSCTHCPATQRRHAPTARARPPATPPTRAFPPPGGSEERLPAPRPAGRGGAGRACGAGGPGGAARPIPERRGPRETVRPGARTYARTHARAQTRTHRHTHTHSRTN